MACVLLALASGAAAQVTEPSFSPRKTTVPRLSGALARIADQAVSDPDAAAASARRLWLANPRGVSVSIDCAPEAVDRVAAALPALGGRSLRALDEVIEARVPAASLRALSEVPGVRMVDEAHRPGRDDGRVTSEGVSAHGATALHASGLTGRGVKVGVIDGGFEGLSALLGSELPPVVRALCWAEDDTRSNSVTACEWDGKHGTGVAESLLDMAPGVELFITNAPTRLAVREAVEWMADNGVRVINHSQSWPWTGSGSGTSLRSDSLLTTFDRAVSRNMVVANAAGNYARSNWAGAVTDTDNDGWLEMDGAEVQWLTAGVDPEDEVRLWSRWEDSWSAAGSDIDIYLVDQDGAELDCGCNPQYGRSGEVPFESITWTAETSLSRIGVSLRREAGRTPDWVQFITLGGYALSGPVAAYSVTEPADSRNPGVLAVGAAPYYSRFSLESFSSRGPTTDGRVKPDLVGADRGNTVTYGAFSGTSQASPHVAGLVALLTESLGPSAGATQLAGAMRSGASPRGAVPNFDWGYGFAEIPSRAPGGTPLTVEFPPRNESLDFRLTLEDKYRNGLGRALRPSYADNEGSVVWTQEYLRYRLNQCDHFGASQRVFLQIDGAGVPPVCGNPASGQIAFPPRDQTVTFRTELETKYRDSLARPPIQTAVDIEGDVVWITEYIRYRVFGCGHVDAVQRVMAQIDGQGVPPVCR